MTRPLVLGLGNILFRDDGVGVRAVERLRQDGYEAEIINGATLGLSLFDIFKNNEKVIVVDAVNMGRDPGTIACFKAEELLSLPENRNFSLHEIGLLEVLKIGFALEENFSNVIIIGIQPGIIEQGEGLSPEVEDKLPEIIEVVKKEVNQDASYARNIKRDEPVRVPEA
jgi:hydrogenase maturation protease